MDEKNIVIENRKGIKLMLRLLLVIAIPMILLFAIAVFSVKTVSENITEAMVRHELNAAQYAFKTSVGNIASGTYMYTNGKFYKGKRNISDNLEFFDNFKNEVDLEVTVFFGDIRVATSLVDEQGNRMLGTTADPVIADIVLNKGENYYSDHVEIAGEEYYASYSPLYQYNKDEIIGMTFVGLNKKEINSIYTSNMIRSVIFLCVILAVGIVLTIFFVRVVIIAIGKVVKALNNLSNGKLNIKLDGRLTRRADEVGDIAISINALIRNFSQIVMNIKHSATNLDSISDNFSSSFGNMASYIQNVDRAVEEIAQSSTQQAQDTAQVGAEIQEMGNAIEKTAKNVKQLVGNTDMMREYNKNVDKTLEELIKISNDTKEAFSVVYEQTNMTNHSAQDIQSAADIITDIADQTSLLSLNASIEAARAGEHGKGFAVVADEIGKLADQSAESANRITGIIEMLIRNSNTTVDTMKNVTEVIDKQGEELQRTQAVFSDLNNEIGEVGAAVDSIKNEIDTLDSLKGRVSVAVESLASIAEENAASTEETSAAMQELRKIVSDCSGDVNTIVEMSETLAENTSSFTLDGDE